MTRTKNQNIPETQEVEEVEVTVEETAEETSKPLSEAQLAYKKLIDTYKEQNPVKYEQKKGELEAKLESL